MSQRDRVASFADVAGFNTLAKMYHLYDAIRLSNAKFCVEIGVYGGRTLLPMALACQENGGRVVGIDPWSAVEAFQPEIAFRTDNINYDKLYNDLIAILAREGLSNVTLFRGTSLDAVALLKDDSIEFLHVDGNHSRDKVFQDVVGYLPKVKTGGIIVMDDASMETVLPAVEYVRARCELLSTDKIGGRDDKTFRKSCVPKGNA